MKISIKGFLFAACFLASSLTLADQTPYQPNKCPDIKLVQEKRAFNHVVAVARHNYIGAEQIDEYDTNATWLIQAGDWNMHAPNKQEAVNQAQKILEAVGSSESVVPIYAAEFNQWWCVWKLPRDKLSLYVLAVTPLTLPHRYHPR